MKKSGHIEQMLFSASEIARMTGFSRSKIYQLIQTGEIPSTVVAGRIRVRRRDLEAWIDGGSRQR